MSALFAIIGAAWTLTISLYFYALGWKRGYEVGQKEARHD